MRTCPSCGLAEARDEHGRINLSPIDGRCVACLVKPVLKPMAAPRDVKQAQLPTGDRT
jgi:hypothetical protein